MLLSPARNRELHSKPPSRDLELQAIRYIAAPVCMLLRRVLYPRLLSAMPSHGLAALLVIKQTQMVLQRVTTADITDHSLFDSFPLHSQAWGLTQVKTWILSLARSTLAVTLTRRFYRCLQLCSLLLHPHRCLTGAMTFQLPIPCHLACLTTAEVFGNTTATFHSHTRIAFFVPPRHRGRLAQATISALGELENWK